MYQKKDSMMIQERFLEFISKNSLFEKTDKILLAISGGMDSIVMAHLFHESKLNFGIAHVNFGLRGEESKADEEFVRTLAKKYKVEFHLTQFQTEEFAQKEGISIQMAARALRYQWFEEIRKQFDYRYIALAHHQADSAETVILNLVRGTMVSGLKGILPKNQNLIRPILFLQKEEIMDILAENRLGWREDSSNSSTKYKRNFVRHEVLPLLKELNPNIEETIQKNAEKITLIESWLKDELENWKKEFIQEKTDGIYIKFSSDLSSKNKVLFSEYLNDLGFHSDQIEKLIQGEISGTGKVIESPLYLLNIDREHYLIVQKSLEEFRPTSLEEGTKEITLKDFKLSVELKDFDSKLKLNQGDNVAILDAELVQWPLEIRTAAEGDWFCPLGMNSKKLISDFLTDKKVPLLIKKKTKILLSGHSICWVVGHRIDNRFKVGENTKKVLILSFII